MTSPLSQTSAAVIVSTPTEIRTAGVSSPHRLPLVGLTSLAFMGFVLIAMETMPAGLLPEIASGMSISESVVGLFVSAYALGTVIVTVPAIALTRRFRRKPLLLSLIAGLILVNSITAFSTDVTVSLASRFLAGGLSGMIWGMLALYALRISPPAHAGRAIAIVSIGAPLGFAFGTPLGTWIGTTFDWRWSFIGLSVLTAAVAAMVLLVVPDASGSRPSTRSSVAEVFRRPGIRLILGVIALWMLAHSTMYTFIAPYLRSTSTGISPELMLLVYGVASLGGIAITGALMDRFPLPLLHLSVVVFITSGVILLLASTSTVAVLVAAALWGLSFGGASAQLQRALARRGGEQADVANSFLPVAFNIAIFGAGVLGGALLAPFGAEVLPVVMIALGAVTLIATIWGRRTAFAR